MISRERVLKAIRRGEPDRVPYCEFGIDVGFAEHFLSVENADAEYAIAEDVGVLKSPFSVDESKQLADVLGLDNIYYAIRAPIFAAKSVGKDGRVFYGEGLIKTEADIQRMDLPDPLDDSLYLEAEEFANHKGDYAACFITRIGLYPTIDSMGFENFCVSLFENPAFVERVFDKYCHWTEAVAERMCQMDFDFFVTTDDMAFNTGPFFSPDVFHNLVLPRFKRVGERLNMPWVLHSDGDISLFLREIADHLNVAGIHPIEQGPMDIRVIKKEYGNRFCLLGNVPLPLLSNGTTLEVDNEVKKLIRDIAPQGGYVVTSGNSLTNYLNPENAVALSKAVQKYGAYPINI